MFKSVEYVGFEDRPDLLEQAERATAMLVDEIQAWRDDVTVVWYPATTEKDESLGLTISLLLPETLEVATGVIPGQDFESGDEVWLRSRLRGVWMDLLNGLISRKLHCLAEFLREPAEV
jgi:hypothetical protein